MSTPADARPTADSVALVVELLAQVLELDETDVAEDAHIADLPGWDSVHSLRLLGLIEREQSVELDFERYAASTSVPELARIVDEAVSAS